MLITETMNEQRRFGFRYFRSYGVKFEESCILASIQEKDGNRGGSCADRDDLLTASLQAHPRTIRGVRRQSVGQISEVCLLLLEAKPTEAIAFR